MADPVVKVELDTLPDESSTALPEFNEHGVLSPGDYFPSRTDFETRFVNYEAVTLQHYAVCINDQVSIMHFIGR